MTKFGTREKVQIIEVRLYVTKKVLQETATLWEPKLHIILIQTTSFNSNIVSDKCGIKHSVQHLSTILVCIREI